MEGTGVGVQGHAGRSQRQLDADSHALAQDRMHSTRKIKRRRHRKMACTAFSAHFSKEEHGGYYEVGILAEWRPETSGTDA